MNEDGQDGDGVPDHIDPAGDLADLVESGGIDLSDEELIELVNTTIAESAELRDRVAKLEEEMVLPETVETVLVKYGLSPEKAAEIVETVEDVEAEVRGDYNG